MDAQTLGRVLKAISSGVGEDQTIVVNTVSGSQLTGRYVFNAVDAGSGILEIVSDSSVRTFIDIDCIVWVSKTATP